MQKSGVYVYYEKIIWNTIPLFEKTDETTTSANLTSVNYESTKQEVVKKLSGMTLLL
jgi:hypothetical protein